MFLVEKRLGNVDRRRQTDLGHPGVRRIVCRIVYAFLEAPPHLVAGDVPGFDPQGDVVGITGEEILVAGILWFPLDFMLAGKSIVHYKFVMISKIVFPTYTVLYMRATYVFIMLLAALSFSSCAIGEGDPLDHVRGSFVAWTSNNNVVVSEDGVTWRDLGTTGYYFFSIANNNSLFVGSLTSAPWSFAVSSNLINWTHYSAPNSQLVGAVMVDGMFYFAGTDTGSTNRCVFRFDGTQLSTVYNSGVSGSLSSIAYGGGRFVVVGINAPVNINVYYGDGSSWMGIHLNYHLHHVIYAHDRFIAVGSDGSSNPIVISSRDGSSWSTNLAPSGPTYVVNRIAYGGGRYVAMGNSYICCSEDGSTWSHYPTNLPLNLYGVAYGNRAFVAVSQVGLIYRSEDGIHWENVYNNNSIGDFQDITLIHNYSLED